MSDSANVQSLQALEDLKTTLTRFGAEAQSALAAAAREIQATRAWLEERGRYWQGEVRRRQEAVAKAQAAYDRCAAAAALDQSGLAEAVFCARFADAVLDAKKRLREAEAEFETVKGWVKVVGQAMADYEREARRLAGLLGLEVPNATTLLKNSIDRLQAYVSTAPPGALAAGSALDQVGLAGMAVLGVGSLDVPAPGPGGHPETPGRIEGEPRSESVEGG
jgi:hypothetical protein